MDPQAFVASTFENNSHARRGIVKYDVVENSDSHAISYVTREKLFPNAFHATKSLSTKCY